MFDLSSKTVLVTGATRGIGRAIAEAFLRCDAKVLATGRSEESISRLKEELNHPNLTVKTLNLSDSASIEAFCENGIQADILVNNAGINKISPVHEINLEDWDEINRVNLRAPLQLSQACLPHMLEKNWGRIVNISSIFGVVSKEKRASYSCSKFGLNGLTKAMALDYGAKGILVNSVSPGFIDTELTRTVLNETQISELVSQVPLKRLGTVNEIANVVAFLASQENSFITGQNITVDGGFTSA